MKWIKEGEKRINLDNISHIQKIDFKRRIEETDKNVAIFGVNFFYAGKGEILVEFLSMEEREVFLQKVDQLIF